MELWQTQCTKLVIMNISSKPYPSSARYKLKYYYECVGSFNGRDATQGEVEDKVNLDLYRNA